MQIQLLRALRCRTTVLARPSTSVYVFLHGHCTFMLSGVLGLLTLPEQQPALMAHGPVNPLVIDLATVDLEPRPNAPVTLCCSVFDHTSKGFIQVNIISFGWWLSQIFPIRLTSLLGKYIAARNTQSRTHRPYCSSSGNKGERAIHFLLWQSPQPP